MRSIEHRLDRDTDEASLLALIETLNQDDMVDGILVQLPLPDQIDADAVINAIRPDKDVDGFHVVNAGLLATGQDSLVPCTPFGCLLLLRDQLGDLSGLHAVDAAAKKAGAITPVPGGVGPMTIACLLRNTLVAAARRHGLTIGKI